MSPASQTFFKTALATRLAQLKLHTVLYVLRDRYFQRKFKSAKKR